MNSSAKSMRRTWWWNEIGFKLRTGRSLFWCEALRFWSFLHPIEPSCADADRRHLSRHLRRCRRDADAARRRRRGVAARHRPQFGGVDAAGDVDARGRRVHPSTPAHAIGALSCRKRRRLRPCAAAGGGHLLSGADQASLPEIGDGNRWCSKSWHTRMTFPLVVFHLYFRFTTIKSRRICEKKFLSLTSRRTEARNGKRWRPGHRSERRLVT